MLDLERERNLDFEKTLAKEKEKVEKLTKKFPWPRNQLSS